MKKRAAKKPKPRARGGSRSSKNSLPGAPDLRPALRAVAKVLDRLERPSMVIGGVAVIPVEMCYTGWQESLALLALLVEPEIPDGP